MQEHGLYYDGNRGCYYSYNQEEQKFEFHSQVYADGTNETNETVTKEEKKKKKKQVTSAYAAIVEWCVTDLISIRFIRFLLTI